MTDHRPPACHHDHRATRGTIIAAITASIVTHALYLTHVTDWLGLTR